MSSAKRARVDDGVSDDVTKRIKMESTTPQPTVGQLLDAPMAARAAGGAVSGMLQHFPQSIDGMPTNNGSAGAGAGAGPAAVTSVAGVTTALPSAAEMAPATATAAAPALGAFMAAGAAAVANTADAAAVQETDQDAERNKWRYDPFQAAKKMRQATKLQLVAAKEKCNCKHSKCLKLYCECFRRGEYCTDCNCKNCTNNVENETARKEAVVSCLERDANAFRSKIAPTMEDETGSGNSKGCKCARSKCLKRYCECFQAGALCTDQCRCTGCRNTVDSKERAALVRMARKHHGGAAAIAAAAAAKKMQCPPVLEADAIEAAAARMVAAALEKKDQPFAVQEEAVLAEVSTTLQTIIETLNGTRREERKTGVPGSADNYFAAVEAAAARNVRGAAAAAGGGGGAAAPAAAAPAAAPVFPFLAVGTGAVTGVPAAVSPPGGSKSVARRL